MKNDKISLTDKQVHRLADDEASYQRGVVYYESGAICNPVRQGKELRGDSGSKKAHYCYLEWPPSMSQCYCCRN